MGTASLVNVRVGRPFRNVLMFVMPARAALRMASSGLSRAFKKAGSVCWSRPMSRMAYAADTRTYLSLPGSSAFANAAQTSRLRRLDVAEDEGGVAGEQRGLLGGEDVEEGRDRLVGEHLQGEDGVVAGLVGEGGVGGLGLQGSHVGRRLAHLHRAAIAALRTSASGSRRQRVQRVERLLAHRGAEAAQRRGCVAADELVVVLEGRHEGGRRPLGAVAEFAQCVGRVAPRFLASRVVQGGLQVGDRRLVRRSNLAERHRHDGTVGVVLFGVPQHFQQGRHRGPRGGAEARQRPGGSLAGLGAAALQHLGQLGDADAGQRSAEGSGGSRHSLRASRK